MAPVTDGPRRVSLGKPAEASDYILDRRYRIVRRFAPKLGGILLDYGCGNGSNTMLFKDDFQKIVGVDVVGSHIADFSRTVAKDPSASQVCPVLYDGDRLPLDDASVDAAVSFEVLEHVVDEKSTLDEIYRVLRPGGWFALTVPNRWWIFETHGANLPILPWNRVPLFSWLPKSIHSRWARARIYRRGDIGGLLTEAGFDVHDIHYVTAPLDVLKWRGLRDCLRGSLFRADITSVPFQATAIFVIATRP